MNIYNLRYFVTLARIRQYTKAAEELCITQPSLSHAISQMEKELGVKLFEKNGHASAWKPQSTGGLRCRADRLRQR